jgi:hypothetical protein
MKTIKIFTVTGSFAEDKDVARDIRINKIIPSLDKKLEVILDFEKVDSTTQSFVHALLSDVIRKFGAEVLDKISFKNCNDTIKGIVNIVVEYMQI